MTSTSPDHGVTNQNVMRHHKLGGLSNHTNFSALCEFVDNSFDAHAQNIRIELREGLNDDGAAIEAQAICKNQTKTALETDHINLGIRQQNTTENTENSSSFRENYRMKTSKNSALYKLKLPTLFIQDDGTGLASIAQLLNVASNVQHSSRDQDIRKGVYGMGAKDAIARLGEYSLILSRMQPRDSKLRDTEEMSGFYNYLLAIYPFDDPEENNESNKLTTNKYAHCTLQVEFKKDSAGKAILTKIKRDITNNPSFQKMMTFMNKKSPFDFGDNVNAMEAFYQTLENLLNQMSVDFKPRKNVRINSETQGTLIMVWGIHQKPSQQRNKRKSTAQNSQLSYHRSDNNRSGSPTTFLEPYVDNIFELTVNLDTDDFHKISLIDHLSEYFAYVETRKIKTKNKNHQKSSKTQQPCIFVQGVRVHPKVFRTLLKKETILMKNVIFQGALDTVTFEIGELKSSCLKTGNYGVGQGINYYWKNRFIKRVPMKNFGDHAIFVDLNKVAAPTQYKNDFRTDMILAKKSKQKEGLWKFSILETKLKKEGRKHFEKVELMKKYKFWNFKDSEYADESYSEFAEFTRTCFVQCLTCGKIREIVNSVLMLNAFGIDEKVEVFPRPDSVATKHCGFSCDDMHLIAHGRELEEGKSWCEFKQNCEIEGLLKGPIGLNCMEMGEYTQNREAKSTRLILKNSVNFNKMFDLANKEHENQLDSEKQKEIDKAKFARLERDKNHKIMQKPTKTTELHEKLLKDLNLKEKIDKIPCDESPKVPKPGKQPKPDIICLDSDDSEYRGPVQNIKCEKLNDTVTQREHFEDIPPTPPQTKNQNSDESIDVPLSPTAAGETDDNDFVKKYGKTFGLKKVCDSNDSNLIKPKVAIIIRTPKKMKNTSEFNFDLYFSDDGDNIWKGLRPLEIHRKSVNQAPVGSNDGEVQVKCHNGVGYEFIAVDETEEKYFNFDKGVIKLGFIQTRMEFCESILLQSGDNPPRKWGVGSDKTQVYMIFSYESGIVENSESVDPHEMYDYINEDLALNETVVEKLVKFFDYMPKKDDLPQRGLNFGLDQGADIGKDYLDTRKEMQNPFEEVTRTAHMSAKCNEWLHKHNYEVTPSDSSFEKNISLTTKNAQKNTQKNPETTKNAKKRTLIHGKWSKATNSKANSSKRAKTSFLSEDEESEEIIENVQNLDPDEIEIDSDEHQENLEKKGIEYRTLWDQFSKNLERKGYDELNPDFKMEVFAEKAATIFEFLEVGLEDEMVESETKRKIVAMRRILGIETEIPTKAGRKRRK